MITVAESKNHEASRYYSKLFTECIINNTTFKIKLKTRYILLQKEKDMKHQDNIYNYLPKGIINNRTLISIKNCICK